MATTDHKKQQLAAQLAAYTITPTSSIQISQMLHRLDILASWFGDYEKAVQGLRQSFVIELGCGQGDMTVALAHTASHPQLAPSEQVVGQVIGIDPAPLDYGSPHTLGESQAHLSSSNLGGTIQWIQREPLEFFSNPVRADYIVLAHSLFYLPSEDYLGRLLSVLRVGVSAKRLQKPKLLLAEWGMRVSTPKAKAHILAVEAQLLNPRKDANVRTVSEPEHIKAVAMKAGWHPEVEHWIEKPVLDDGKWEVSAARGLVNRDGSNDEFTAKVEQMEKQVQRCNGEIESMDVWTGVFSPA